MSLAKQMYASGALAGIFIALIVSQAQKADPDEAQTNIKHSLQELRLIAYLLFAILVALGVIADRIH